jgi:hypothetical protein
VEAEPLAALVIVSATLLFLLIKMLVTISGEDRDTIAAFIKERQGRLISAKRLMFGSSWRGEGFARAYDVRFIDAAGVQLQTYCTVFMTGKAEFYEVRVIGGARALPNIPAAPVPPAEHDSVIDLAAENRRLKEELEQLRRSTPPQA